MGLGLEFRSYHFQPKAFSLHCTESVNSTQKCTLLSENKVKDFDGILKSKCLEIKKKTKQNQTVLKEINSEYVLEGLMLKIQHCGHLMRRSNSLEKTLMLGKTEGRRTRGRQWMRWPDGISPTQWTWV